MNIKRAILALTVSLVMAPLVETTSTPALATGAPVILMPLGDSITKGVGSPGTSGYRIFLQGNMKAASSRRVDFVGSQRNGACCDKNHEGHGGWDTREMLPYVDKWLDRHNPNFVLLHMGTNDITAQRMGKSGFTSKEIAYRLGKIVRKIHAHNPSTHVYVAKITGTTIPSYSRATNAFNSLVPGVVKKEKETYHNPRTYLVDMSDIKGRDLYDSRHPNKLGYEKMNYKWYERIRQTIPGASRWPRISNPWRYTRYTLCFWNQATKSRSCGNVRVN